MIVQKDMAYTCTPQKSDFQYLSEDGDPSLARTTELLNNLQGAETAMKSKVAKSADASMKGKGVLSQPRNGNVLNKDAR